MKGNEMLRGSMFMIYLVLWHSNSFFRSNGFSVLFFFLGKRRKQGVRHSKIKLPLNKIWNRFLWILHTAVSFKFAGNVNKNLKRGSPQRQGCPRTSENEQREIAFSERWKITDKISKIISVEIFKCSICLKRTKIYEVKIIAYKMLLQTM